MSDTQTPLWKRFLAGRNPRWTLIRVVVLIVLGVLLIRVFVPVRVSGVSMEPTFKDGSIAIINRFAYFKSVPGRGDVVAIQWAGNRAWLLKRIIGLPGDKVAITRNSVEINGGKMEETYALWGDSIWNVAPITLGEDEYLVIGDNRDMSQAEHVFGRVARDRVIGKVLR